MAADALATPLWADHRLVDGWVATEVELRSGAIRGLTIPSEVRARLDLYDVTVGALDQHYLDLDIAPPPGTAGVVVPPLR